MAERSIHSVDGFVERPDGMSGGQAALPDNRRVDVETDPQTAEMTIKVQGPEGTEILQAGYHQRILHGDIALRVTPVVPAELADRDGVFDGLAQGVEQIEEITGVPAAEVPLVDPSIEDVEALQERGFEIPAGEVIEVEVDAPNGRKAPDTVRIKPKRPIRKPLPEALDLNVVELRPGQEVSLRRRHS